MTTNYIDQLTEWWENAEEGVIEKGDTVINRSDGETTVYVATVRARRQHPNTRILARAPKPKPAWHDAVAVIAEVHAFDLPRVFVKDDDGIWNDALTGRGYSPDALSHVTPLIEAKVTDEARERVWRVIQKYTGEDDRHRPDYDAEIDGYITAALGLDPA